MEIRILCLKIAEFNIAT